MLNALIIKGNIGLVDNFRTWRRIAWNCSKNGRVFIIKELAIFDGNFAARAFATSTD
jgi:hypothetical protein